MWEDVSREIEQAKMNIQLKNRVASRLQSCRTELAKEQQVNEGLRAELEKHEKIVHTLQGVSISHLFHRILGDLETHESETEQSIVKTKMQLDASNATMDHLKADIQDLEKQSADLARAEQKYNELLEEKSHLIMLDSPELWNELVDLSDKHADWLTKQREIGEAQSAAESAMSALSACAESLDKAGGWGVADMAGGGVITTAIKRDHMEDANGFATLAQHALRRLSRELKDVQLGLETPLTSQSALLAFSDYFFDGLIVDWMVQSEIREAQRVVEEQQVEVQRILNQLATLTDEVNRNLDALEQERRRVIETAK